MTLKEMKAQTYSLIEEYYPESENLAEDEDVINKANGVINQIIMDLMKYRKISAYETFEIAEDDDRQFIISDALNDLYQLNKVVFEENTPEYIMPDSNTIVFPKDYSGTFTIYYYKLPNLCKTMFENDEERAAYDSKFTFDLDQVLLEIMPYGVAADLLKMDMISNYGEYFYKRYLELKNAIDSRKTAGSILITGGAEI